MNRMWEIREGEQPDKTYNRSYKRMQSRSYNREGAMQMREGDPEYDEAFEEGFKCALDIIKKAVHKEMEGLM